MQNVINGIVDNIVLPLVYLAFAIATFFFIWGAIGLFKDNDATNKNEAKMHLLYGTIGITIMISVFGIIRFVASTVGQTGALGF